MNIQIKALRHSGDLKQERIVLKVLKDDDIGYYIVMDTTYTSDGNVSNLVRFPFWFPDKPVKTGDLVVLYTKKGQQSEKQNKNGTTSHFFYRGLERTVWNEKGDCAVVLHVDNWAVKGVE